MTSSLDFIQCDTNKNPSYAIIWLHGLGANGHDFEAIVPELALPNDLGIRFIFPHAPSMPVSLNGGFVMPAWYDIKHSDLGFEQDAAGIKRSSEQIQSLIEQQKQQGISADKIILAGFSQGGAMALHIGLRQTEALAGVMALSCYIPLDTQLESERCLATKPTHFFIAHGKHDPVVALNRGQHTAQTLKGLDYHTQWHEYDMEHSVCPQEIKDISAWIQKTLP